MSEEKEKCQRCECDAEEEHPCPFDADVYNSETLCNCCEKCQNECAMDI